MVLERIRLEVSDQELIVQLKRHESMLELSKQRGQIGRIAASESS